MQKFYHKKARRSYQASLQNIAQYKVQNFIQISDMQKKNHEKYVEKFFEKIPKNHYCINLFFYFFVNFTQIFSEKKLFFMCFIAFSKNNNQNLITSWNVFSIFFKGNLNWVLTVSFPKTVIYKVGMYIKFVCVQEIHFWTGI